MKYSEGTFHYSGVREIYKGLHKLHFDMGLANITWDERENIYRICIIFVFASKDEPEIIMGATTTEGYFKTKSRKKIAAGDKICLNYLRRIGIKYASSGTKPEGNYEWLVSGVVDDREGYTQEIRVDFEEGETKAYFLLKRAE